MKTLTITRVSVGTAKWLRTVQIKQYELDEWIDHFKKHLITPEDVDKIPEISITDIPDLSNDKTTDWWNNIEAAYGSDIVNLRQYIMEEIDDASYNDDPELVDWNEEDGEIEFD